MLSSADARDLRAQKIIVGITLLLLLPLFRPVVAPIDPVGYYAWARSILIDGDLNVANEFEHYGMAAGVPTTPKGYLHNQWPAGTGILWLPAMGLTHTAILGANRLGLAVKPDGYSPPYAWAAALTSTAVGLGAVLLMYRLNRRYAGSFAALISVLVIWLATPLVFYQYHQPLMSHALDALLNGLFIAAWLWVEQNDRRLIAAATLGLVIGAAIWVRPQNGILLIAVCLVLAYDIVNHRCLTRDPVDVAAVAKQVGGLAGGCAVLVVPLMLFWHKVYGRWLVNSYQTGSGDGFDWRAPHVADVLFSTDRGLFVWTPVALLCIAGIWWLMKKARRLTALLSIVALMDLYVISSWSSWSGGDAFGPRFWIGQFPFLSLALAALVDYLDQTVRVRRFWLVSSAAGFIMWNFLLMLQYSLGILPPSGTVRLATMVEQQFIVLPHLGIELTERIRRLLAQLQ